MRLWTLHPKHLDARGLVAVWREGLLAQAVLRGQTLGYRQHPQVTRFRNARGPLSSISWYLRVVQQEATSRGYKFDITKVGRGTSRARLVATTGQLKFEWRHLRAKLAVRDRGWLRALRRARLEAHPMFRIVPGPIASWEGSRASRRT
jgi:hypothetical protein